MTELNNLFVKIDDRRRVSQDNFFSANTYYKRVSCDIRSIFLIFLINCQQTFVVPK